MSTVTLDHARAARETIAGLVHRTPIYGSETLSHMTGTRLHLKAENLQKTGSFKVRGAINACRHLSHQERERGVIGVSAGNHAAALAYGARIAGTRATVVMPDHAQRVKIAAVEGYGGRPVLVDGKRLLENMREIQEREGSTLIHPFDNAHMIAGAGTVALEIIEDVDGQVDAIVVPVGGGGLLSGVATVVKALAPTVSLIGVEPEGSNVVSQSLAAGRPLRLEHFETIADGLNAPWSAQLSLEIIRKVVDDIVTVSDHEIAGAMRLILERTKLVVEPAGAAALAALLAGVTRGLEGKRVVVILSGGNVDVSRIGQLLAEIGPL
jgi:threonine dehydratase